jgi:hypothetical protein
MTEKKPAAQAAPERALPSYIRIDADWGGKLAGSVLAAAGSNSSRQTTR